MNRTSAKSSLIISFTSLVTVGFGLAGRHSSHAAGTTYYVATIGSDSNPGTASQPFQTIQKAADAVQPGDTVMVLPGTYTQPVLTTVSGTADARIRFESQDRWEAKTKTPVALWSWANEGNYVDIVGFDVSESSNGGILNWASHVRIMRNYVHDIPPVPCNDPNGGAGIENTGAGSTPSSDSEVFENVVHDIGDPGDSSCASRLQHGIYHDQTGGQIINNIVYHIAGYGILLYRKPTDVKVLNNTVFNSGSSGILVEGIQAVAENVLVANNIAVNNRVYGIEELAPTGTDNRYLNNLVFGNDGGGLSLQNGSTQQGTVTADPSFVDPSSGDFHLQPSSPAADAGVTLPEVPDDFDGNSRPLGEAYSIGAYE